MLIYNIDILKKIPREGTIFYLFNPFNEEVMKCFLNELEKNIMHEIRLFYLYPTEENVFKKRKNWEMVNKTFLKPKFSGLGEIELLEFKYSPNCFM